MQIIYELESKFNQTCGPRPKWNIYNAELIYKNLRKLFPRQNPIYDSLRDSSPLNTRLDMNCLRSFGIEFNELKLMRIEERPTSTSFGDTHEYLHLQLLLANPVPHVYFPQPTSLQATAMVRANMVYQNFLLKDITYK